MNDFDPSNMSQQEHREAELHKDEMAFASALKDLVNGDLAAKIPRESVIEWLESLAFAMQSHDKEG